LVRRVLTWTGLVLVAALVAGLNFYQLPVVTLLPGPAEDVLPQIKVTGSTKLYATDGHLYLTTVGVDDRVNFYEALLDFADRDVQVVPRSAIYPDDQSQQEVDLENAAEMDSSKLAATIVGLREAGFKVDTDPDGVRIVGVVPGSAAEHKLEPEDRVVSVAGKPVGSAEDLRKAIGAATVGRQLAFEVQRGRRTLPVTVTPGAAPTGPRRPYVGISLADVFDFPVNLQIETENIGGPSAGLMFTLAVVERLGREDLTRGRSIAGTGTMDFDGKVGPIGGIRQKLIAARRMGATTFFVPADNWSEAQGGKPRGLELVKVTTVDDALRWLRAGSNVEAASP
jgi:PDZ domain-containing protein